MWKSNFRKKFMGSCESSTKSSGENVATAAEANIRNSAINRTIELDRRQNESTIKLLLLGAGESGKSTVLKQMKILHDNGWSKEDALAKRNMIYANVIQGMYYILTGMHKCHLSLANQVCQEHGKLIHAIMASNLEAEKIRENVYVALSELWADKGIQAALDRKSDFYLPDCARYFLDSLDRICAPDYVPTTQDILYLRVATMGVIEVTFTIKSKIFRVFDVGGQRSQRKKWIHCFDDVRAVIFIVAISEFDQTLLEDGSTNRLLESLQLFRSVCNNRYFLETSVILFLNKKDLFLEKLEKGRSLRIAFYEFNGPDTYEVSSKYIEKKFFAANEVPNKIIYCHHTCATDTKQVEFVLEAVYDAILSSKLKGCGLY